MNRLAIALLLAAVVAAVTAQQKAAHRPPPGVSLVAGMSPFPTGCNGSQNGTNYPNATVESYIAADPANPLHFIGVWQQDRWTNGGASGLLSAATFDGGAAWTRSSAAFTVCSGGTWGRASDPWVSIGPDGRAYQIALALGSSDAGPYGIIASTSSDGGLTWNLPVTLDVDPTADDDKEAVTADLVHPGYAYAVWDRYIAPLTPALLSRTTDGGATWSPYQIVNNGISGVFSTTSNQIVCLPDGVPLNVFVLSRTSSFVSVLRSLDSGVTWSAAISVAQDDSIATVDPKTQQQIRDGGLVPAAAVDRSTGVVYIAWQDARFSVGQREGIAMSQSSDDGLTWSAPVQVNQAVNTQAFTPAIAAANGTIAATYYDFRKDNNDPNVLLTNLWRVTSTDGGNTWTESPIAGPFDMLSAPVVNGMPFLGDYSALASGGNFLAFFTVANSGNALNPSSVMAASRVFPGDTSSNGRIEINRHPHTFNERLLEKRRGEIKVSEFDVSIEPHSNANEYWGGAKVITIEPRPLER
jgi:hypothetical protein